MSAKEKGGSFGSDSVASERKTSKARSSVKQAA